MEFFNEAKELLKAGKELFKYYHTHKEKAGYLVNASLYDIKEFFQGRDEKGKMKPVKIGLAPIPSITFFVLKTIKQSIHIFNKIHNTNHPSPHFVNRIPSCLVTSPIFVLKFRKRLSSASIISFLSYVIVEAGEEIALLGDGVKLLTCVLEAVRASPLLGRDIFPSVILIAALNLSISINNMGAIAHLQNHQF